MGKITFGTDGWRDLIARNFTFENVNIVAKAIGFYIRDNSRNRPVVVGYDTRFLADEFAMEVSNVLNEMGFNTLMSKLPIPTPVIAYAAKKYNTGGAIMLTASHNPPQYCGIKYIPPYAGPATPEITDEIVSNVKFIQEGSLKVKPAEKKGTLEYIEPKTEYFEMIKSLIDLEKFSELKIKVAYDALYGTGQGYLEEVLAQISKCEIKSLHNTRDVLFGGGMPEPSEKYLYELKSFILENNYALGLANDGDADRFGVMDETGTFYTPNQVISLLLRHLVKNKGIKGSVVRTVATTHLLDKLAKLYEVKLIETPVGFKYVGAQMRDTEVIIGGEESGGLSVFGHIPEKDGILADLLVVEMLAYENKSLSEIWRELLEEVGYEPFGKRLDLHLSDEDKKALMNKFINETPGKIGTLRVTGYKKIDGMKLLLEDGNSWVLARPSGTEPMVRVYLETDSPEKLQMLEQAIKELIPNG